MRIRTFSKFVEGEVTSLVLHDTSVVVDGQNFFYETYEQAHLTSTFGIECDRYALYLREYLSMFKKANVKCYFLFRGGHEDVAKSLELHKDSKIIPVLMKQTYKQVLDEMGLKYVVCEYESKKDIIALAQKLECPVISFNIEFCFSGLEYIPSNTIKFNERNDTIYCGSFSLANFLRKRKLSVEKVAMFVVLRDEQIFSEDTFADLFKYLRTPPGPFKRNLHILRWLSEGNRDHHLKIISLFLSNEDKEKFIEQEAKMLQFIGRSESGGLGAASLLDRSVLNFTRNDPQWFSKGVSLGHIVADYVNLYRPKIFLGAPAMGFEPNATIISLDIVYYAYDLMTNFQNEGFTFIYDSNQGKETMRVQKRSIKKPACDIECVFQNGWDGIKPLGLLEHFVKESLQIDLVCFKSVPAQARLLLLALVLFSRRNTNVAAVKAALLCYVTLEVVNDYNLSDFQGQPIDSTYKNVDELDRRIAADKMKHFSNASHSDVEQSDGKLVYTVAELQQCFLQLSSLNSLCGEPLRTPIFSRTYNGTLIYNLMHAGVFGGATFSEDLLRPATTVYEFFNGLLQTLKQTSPKFFAA